MRLKCFFNLNDDLRYGIIEYFSQKPDQTLRLIQRSGLSPLDKWSFAKLQQKIVDIKNLIVFDCRRKIGDNAKHRAGIELRRMCCQYNAQPIFSKFMQQCILQSIRLCFGDHIVDSPWPIRIV